MPGNHYHWRNTLKRGLLRRGRRHLVASAHQPATLTGKRIFVLPTKPGLVFMGLLIVMLLGATNYSNNMAFALTFLLGSVLVISIVHTYRNMVELQVRLVQADDCFAGGHAIFSLSFINDTSRPRYDIKVLTASGSTTTVTLNSFDRDQGELSIPASERGRLELGRVTLESRYPFGLFRAWSYLAVEGDALVYPRPGEKRAQANNVQAAGEGVQTQELGSDDFHGFRSYQNGDSLRHVNWKAYARERGLVTKQFQRHQSPEHWLDLRNAQGTTLENRLSQLCRWVLDADKEHQRYGLRLLGQEIPISEGPAHRRRCLQALALFGDEA